MQPKGWNWTGALPVLIALLLLATGSGVGRVEAAGARPTRPNPCR